MSEVDFRQAIKASNQDPIPRDIVVQVWLAEQGVDAVLQRLYREMEILAPLLARDRRVVRLAFEGRGLSALSPLAKSDLMDSLAQHFSLAPAATNTMAVAADDCDLLGLGPGAVSRFGEAISMNAADPTVYCNALDQGRLPIVE